MKTSSKFLGAIVTLLIVVSICVIAVNLYNKGKSSANETVSQYDSVLSQYGDVQLANYDEGSASGSEITKLIKALSSSDGTYNITVITAMNTDGDKYYTKTSNTVVESKKEADYINPSANFTSQVYRNGNGIITEVVFTQTGVTTSYELGKNAVK